MSLFNEDKEIILRLLWAVVMVDEIVEVDLPCLVCRIGIEPHSYTFPVLVEIGEGVTAGGICLSVEAIAEPMSVYGLVKV